MLSGAAEALRQILIERLGDSYFTSKRRNESARAAIFTRKVGHTQRGGRPVHFDRFYGVQLGGHAVDLLLEGHVNGVAILQWNRDRGFYIDGVNANDFRDRYGVIHARQVHPAFYDREALRPSRVGSRLPAADLLRRHWCRRHGGRAADTVPYRATSRSRITPSTWTSTSGSAIWTERCRRHSDSEPSTCRRTHDELRRAAI